MPKSSKGKKRKSRGSSFGLYLFVLAFLAVILYLTGGVRSYHGNHRNDSQIAANIAMLEERQAQSVPDLDLERKVKYRAMLDARGGIMIDDMEAEQTKILAMDKPKNAEIVRRLDGAVIVGDSIVEACGGFGWLNSSINLGVIGVRVNADNKMIERAISLNPSVVFMVYGTNDIEVYKSNSDTFISRYREALLYLKNSLPDAVIYVHNVFPSISGKKCYAYRDEYNAKLRALCEEMSIYFIDSDFILRERKDLFDKDGIHPKSAFYPKWLIYLADIAGLNND